MEFNIYLIFSQGGSKWGKYTVETFEKRKDFGDHQDGQKTLFERFSTTISLHRRKLQRLRAPKTPEEVFE